MTPPLSEAQRMELLDIRRRHEQAIADIQNNFGAAYSSRITQDSYSIHEDRATLLNIVDAQARALSARESQLTLTAAQGENIEIEMLIGDALRRVSKD